MLPNHHNFDSGLFLFRFRTHEIFFLLFIALAGSFALEATDIGPCIIPSFTQLRETIIEIIQQLIEDEINMGYGCIRKSPEYYKWTQAALDKGPKKVLSNPKIVEAITVIFNSIFIHKLQYEPNLFEQAVQVLPYHPEFDQTQDPEVYLQKAIPNLSQEEAEKNPYQIFCLNRSIEEVIVNTIWAPAIDQLLSVVIDKNATPLVKVIRNYLNLESIIELPIVDPGLVEKILFLDRVDKQIIYFAINPLCAIASDIFFAKHTEQRILTYYTPLAEACNRLYKNKQLEQRLGEIAAIQTCGAASTTLDAIDA